MGNWQAEHDKVLIHSRRPASVRHTATSSLQYEIKLKIGVGHLANNNPTIADLLGQQGPNHPSYSWGNHANYSRHPNKSKSGVELSLANSVTNQQTDCAKNQVPTKITLPKPVLPTTKIPPSEPCQKTRPRPRQLANKSSHPCRTAKAVPDLP
ncbi:unnamed protein product [Prunus armeniaca]|uniref:Uncharacterized protein n=1 Tax=Prunus armeniaca TaxID=36596 RepID=A0A6J5ULR8_PRUAR|nr:unnamed protein product [Prunus armeniaca]